METPIMDHQSLRSSRRQKDFLPQQMPVPIRGQRRQPLAMPLAVPQGTPAPSQSQQQAQLRQRKQPAVQAASPRTLLLQHLPQRKQPSVQAPWPDSLRSAGPLLGPPPPLRQQAGEPPELRP